MASPSAVWARSYASGGAAIVVGSELSPRDGMSYPARTVTCMPADELIERHRAAVAGFTSAVGRLRPVLEAIAVAAVRDVVPTAARLEVLGEMNEDWAWTLRIQRVLDVDGAVLFDGAVGGAAELEDHLHEVGFDYLDLLLQISGEEYLGRHEIEA